MRCFNCHIAILYVQVVDSQRKSMYGNSRKRAGNCHIMHSDNLALFSLNNQILSTFHCSFSLQPINILQASTERK